MVKGVKYLRAFSAELELAVRVAGANMMAGLTISFRSLSNVRAPNNAVVATECPTNATCSIKYQKNSVISN